MPSFSLASPLGKLLIVFILLAKTVETGFLEGLVVGAGVGSHRPHLRHAFPHFAGVVPFSNQ